MSKFRSPGPALALATAIGGALAMFSPPGAANPVSVTALVTDDPTANPAQTTDPGLVNAWGISYGPTGPFWISSNGAGTSTVYKVDPTTQLTAKQGLTVPIPGAGNVTGQVFNAGGSSQFGGNTFLFVSEDGTVSGWKGSTGLTTTLSSSQAVFKGAAYASVAGSSYLYAADFAGGAIDVFKGTAGAPALSGTFTDPNLPSGFAPFNVQQLGGSLYVAYAKQDPGSPDEVDGAGLGYVDRFDLQGNLVSRIAGGGALNAPWGLAIAPTSFGAFAGSLLVGNFGDGRISAYSIASQTFLGQLTTGSGAPVSIDGLWGLSVGNNGSAGSSQALYFTAGPGGESHGLFGVLQAVPEPATTAMFGAGLAVFAWRARRQKQGRLAAEA